MKNERITWSPYQEAFFDALTTTTDSIMLVAVAGAGKSTTIVEGVKRLPTSKSVTFLAFNKAIATELEPRMPAHAKAKTFHSVGFSAWARAQGGFGKVKVDANKTRKVMRNVMSDKEQEILGAYVAKLVGHAKSAGVGKLMPMTAESFMRLADHHGLYIDRQNGFGDQAEAIALMRAMEVLTASNARLNLIDFDDMLYLPLLHDVAFFRNDVVFIDEAQDTNAVQIALLKRMVKRGGRVIAVGDPAQAIYGFRGADADAVDNIKGAFGMIELPLTVSYRCARAVIAEAQRLVSHIEPSDTAPEGSVTVWDQEAAPVFEAADAILCRTVAPLFAQAYRMIAAGQGCRILGREIGEGLVTLIKRMEARDIDGLEARLDRFLARETEKLMARDQDSAAEALSDRVSCITTTINNLPEGNRTVGALVDRIRGMFESNGPVTTLATVHKAKGLEWNRVYILNPELMPHPMARRPWEQQQETHIQYVAITRAKRELVYYSPPKEG